MTNYIDRVEHLADNKDAIKFIRQQIEKLKDTNPTHMLNPLEPEGVRIAETNIDRKVMFIIKELFGQVYSPGHFIMGHPRASLGDSKASHNKKNTVIPYFPY
jgi:hypothetical protein